MTTDIFGSSDNSDNVDPLTYVTERYKNDAGELDIAKLARAALEKDKHIKNVEGENAELRGEVKTRIGLEEFLTKMSNQPKEEGNNPPGNHSQPQAPEPVDIEQLVNQHLTKAEHNRIKQRNQQVVNDTLTTVWGNDTAKNFQRTASTLGMGVDELKALAERSPQAFFRLAGVSTDPSRPSVGSVPQGSFNIGNEGGSEVRNQAFYSKLKKTDPKSYFSTKTQMQMHQDANNLGERFFK